MQNDVAFLIRNFPFLKDIDNERELYYEVHYINNQYRRALRLLYYYSRVHNLSCLDFYHIDSVSKSLDAHTDDIIHIIGADNAKRRTEKCSR